MPLPEYKPGDYLECGEGEGFSRVLVLSENNVLVKGGPATGDVMPLDEWYFIVGEARSTIRNVTYFDIEKVDTLCVSHAICGDPSIDSLGKNSTGSNSTGSNSIGSNSTGSNSTGSNSIGSNSTGSNSIGRKSCIRTSSTSSMRSVTINTQPTVIEGQTTLRSVEVPSKPRNWSDWFAQVFLCGLID